MRRANVLTGLFVVVVALLGGCTERDSPLESGRPLPFDNSVVASNELPEVVITAPRLRSSAIVLSQSAPAGVPSR
jgi:hypothetical protein